MLSDTNTDYLPQIQENEFLPPVGNWVVLGGLSVVGLIALAVPVASVVKYKEVVKADAKVRPAGEVRLVQSSIEGPITKILAKENQVVKQGEVLAMIDSDHLRTKSGQLQKNIQQAQQQKIQISAQLVALNRQITAEKNRMGRVLASTNAELSRRYREYRDKHMTSRAEVEEAQANLRSTQAALSAAQSKRDRYQSVSQQGALSKNQLDEAKLDVQQQEQAAEAARAKIQFTKAALNPSGAEVAIAREQIAQEQATGEAALAKLVQEREALVQQQLETDKLLGSDRAELKQIELDLRRTKITATASGTIAQLNLRNSGQTIRPGEEVAQIAPSDVALEVKTSVSPQDIGKVKVEQPVSMRISACPYPDYGTLNGKVSQVSQDTVKPQRTDAAGNNASESGPPAAAFYKVIIKPDKFSLEQGTNQCSIELGMEGRADIITREETVLRFILRKVRLITDL